MSYKQPVSTLVVIYTTALEVLLLERADHPGFWQSVTGSRDDEEQMSQTAAREVFEETGLLAENYKLTDWHYQNVYEIYPVWRHRYPPGVTQNTEHVFGLELSEKPMIKITPREHLNYVWLPWREAAEKCFSPSNRAAIMQLPQRVRS
jgi:dihydroneopterin triphosphate diphosphatase